MSDPLERLRQGLAERYTVERELGSGGMAVVFLARDLKHDRPVAIKVLRPELAAALGAERFLREIRLSAQLHHPHILPLYDSGEVASDPARGEGGGPAGPGILYYVMPWVEGETLRDRIERETQLPLHDALQIAREVADALGYAHGRGVVHRDIKPENILLESGHALVADFGIARAVTAAGGEKLTETGLAVGTPLYMSPEQASGEQRLDGRSDLYSLACVLYEMLAGEPPYTGRTAQAIIARRLTDPVPPLRTVRETVPVQVAQAIDRALARVPADRFATAAQFVEALAGAHPVTAPAWRPPRAARAAFRRPVAAALAVTALTAGAFVVVRARRSPIVPSASVIAVLPFVPSVPDTALARLGGDLMMTVSRTLDGVGPVRTVDRYAILTAAVGPNPMTFDRAAGLSRRLGAGSFVQGGLARDAAGVRLDLGIYRTDTHAPLGPVIVVRAPPDSLVALSDSITLALLRQIWRGTPPSVFLEDVTTRSLPALSAFLEGEREAVAGRWPEAANAFRRAATADTTFWVAGWRYYQALGWQGKEDDDPRIHTYASHLAAFEPRDRAIIRAEDTYRVESFEEHLSRFRDLAEQYPDDWVAAMEYGDHLTHAAPLAGHTKAEARKVLERAASLNPALTDAWDHLLQTSLGQDSSDARMALDALTRLGALKERSSDFGFDVALWYRLAFQLQRGEGGAGRPLLDSVARAVAASDSRQGNAFGAYALLAFGYPAAQSELDVLVLRRGPHSAFAPAFALTAAYSWVARGAWDSALVALDRYAESYPDRAAARGSAVEAYRLAAVGAWLSALDAQSAVQRRAAATLYVGGLADSSRAASQRAVLAWADGLLAVRRSDPNGLAAARGALRHNGATQAAFLDRSLRALGLTLGRSTRLAAESLAVIDERATEVELFADSARDPLAVSVLHLAAASALLAVGDTGRARRALAWHEAWGPPGGGVSGEFFAGLAYLKLAQIEEAQGHRDLAREHYGQLVRRYDMPVPALRHLVDEAQAALRRLS
ncbi:MAG TPA: serine/threonine-protein kinase [Gemmatimonadales bacterium]|nr:serine/threonine-protein kinase [Gemmatimonadales bacterium]